MDRRLIQRLTRRSADNGQRQHSHSSDGQGSWLDTLNIGGKSAGCGTKIPSSTSRHECGVHAEALFEPGPIKVPPNWRSPSNESKQWWSQDSQERYEENLRRGRTPRYSATDIEYRFNALGYRSDEFTTPPPNALKVLALGCSITQGVGLPLEHTWPHLVCRRLESTLGRPVVNYNLGSPAASNEGIVARGMRAVDALKPDVVFIQYTFAHRRLYAEDNGDLVEWMRPTESELLSSDSSLHALLTYYTKVQTDWADLNRLLMLLHLFNGFVESRGGYPCSILSFQRWRHMEFLRPRLFGIRALDNVIRSSHSARDMVHPGLPEMDKLATQLTERYLASVHPETGGSQ